MLRFVSCADCSTGRIDPSMLSAQAAMEVLVSNFTSDCQRQFYSKDGNLKDICSWTGVDCDEDDAVRNIFWGQSRLVPISGTFDTQFLPSTLQKLYLSGADLKAPIVMTNLPEGMTYILLSKIPLSASIDLSALPRRLKDFVMMNCEFFGELDIEALPPPIERFDIADTPLTGSIDLTKMPKCVTKFSVYHCELVGTLDLTHLHAPLKFFILGKNFFEGEVCLTSLPDTLFVLNISDNNLCGQIDISNLPRSLKRLVIYCNDFSGVLDLRTSQAKAVVVHEPDTYMKPYVRSKFSNEHLKIVTE